MAEELQVRGTFTSHFDMDQFPLDTQELSVIIQVRPHTLLPYSTPFTQCFIRRCRLCLLASVPIP